MIARAINMLTLPAHRRAVQDVAAALLDRHGLTGAEVGQITFAANAVARASAPCDTEGRL